jgi:hypothetical protein
MGNNALHSCEYTFGAFMAVIVAATKRKISPADTKKTVGWSSRPQTFRHPIRAQREMGGSDMGFSSDDKTATPSHLIPGGKVFFTLRA